MAVIKKYDHRIQVNVDGETKSKIRQIADDLQISESSAGRELIELGLSVYESRDR